MAKLEIIGFDDMMARYNRAESRLRPVIEEALRQSGEALAEELLAQEKKFKKPSYALGESIVLTQPWHVGSASGVYQNYEGMYTGLRGGGEKAGSSGRRAAFVAAMQEHQNKNTFNKKARKKAEPRINSIIAEAVGGVHSSLGTSGGGI